MPSEKDTDWIYRKSTKKLLMRLLLLGCAISVLMELVVWDRGGKFGVDGWFGFYALLGFVSCTLMIFAAKGLGLWLKVPTNFYDQEEAVEEDALKEAGLAGNTAAKKAPAKKAPTKKAATKKAATKKAATKKATKKVAKKVARKTTKEKEGGAQ